MGSLMMGMMGKKGLDKGEMPMPVAGAVAKDVLSPKKKKTPTFSPAASTILGSDVSANPFTNLMN